LTRPLTMRQAFVLNAIAEYIRSEGMPPTLREIGDRTGIRSTNGVNDHLRALEKWGYIERRSKKARAIRIIRQVGARS